MPRRLILANLLFGAISVGLIFYIVREVTWTPPLPSPKWETSRPRYMDDAAPALWNARGLAGVIVARNIFDPTRREPIAAIPEPPAVIGVPPVLHGLFISDDAAIAYVEYPATKHAAPYRIG